MFGARLNAEQMGRHDRRSVWRLREDLPWWVWGGLIRGKSPTGFWTDFASVPRHCGMYELFGGVCNREAVPHDQVYRKDCEVQIVLPEVDIKALGLPDSVEDWVLSKGSGIVSPVPKPVADHILKRLIIEEGWDPVVFEAFFTAVWIGGGSSYHKLCMADEIPLDCVDKVSII